MRKGVATAVVLAVALGAACAGDDESAAPASLSPDAARGRQLALDNGCQACHSIDGGAGAGPAWRGVAGSEVTLADGATVVADAAYLRRSITDPAAQVVGGYAPLMPAFDLDDADLVAIVAYLEALGTP